MRSFRHVLLPLLLVLLTYASTAQLRQIAMVDIPGQPGFDCMVFAGNYLVIAHRGANAVDIFDPRLRRLKAQITGMSDPRGIAVDATTGRVYIANAGNNSLAVLSSTDWKEEDTIPLPHSPEALPASRRRFTLCRIAPLHESPGDCAGGVRVALPAGGPHLRRVSANLRITPDVSHDFR